MVLKLILAMDFRFLFLLVTSLFCGGCSTANMFKGQNDYYKHHHAEVLKDSIDSAIASEERKEPPNGHWTKSYSRELWNEYWNFRIFHIHGLEKEPYMKAYRGPTGEEFIRYIIKERRRNGLPELIIEERNKDRVPDDVMVGP